jgi:HSP20 family molecular chaperone IbpA
MFQNRSTDKKYEVSDNSDLGWTLKLPLPGIDKSDISIESVNQNTIKVSVINGNTWVKKSDRLFNLPASSDINGISADFNNGILSIDIPKIKDEVSKKIKIK